MMEFKYLGLTNVELEAEMSHRLSERERITYGTFDLSLEEQRFVNSCQSCDDEVFKSPSALYCSKSWVLNP